MSGRRILNDDQLDTMCELREEGASYERIARHFIAEGTAISPKTIRWQCLRLGAFPPGPPDGNIGIHRGGQGIAFTPDDDRQLLDLAEQGYSRAEIGRRIGRPANSITGRIYTLAFHDEKGLSHG